jgi:hypothetical protein
MAVAPEHFHAARLVVPRLPLAAILGFSLFGVGGSVFLAYTAFSHIEMTRAAAPSNDARVYEARAVPFDSPREDPAQRAASIARALTATQTDVRRAEIVEPDQPSSVSVPILVSDSDRELRGFNRFASYGAANNYLTITGASFGISAQSAPSGLMAADAETLTAAPVPEASTWMCGGALFLLVAARGVRARWHRKRRRD